MYRRIFMESENKYLKQIRDELKKKNGSTGHSLYNDPNSKAKYLRDIAKEIHKFNGGGGGSDNTVIVNVTDFDDSGDFNIVTLDKSYRQIEQLLLDGKDIKIYYDYNDVSLSIFNNVLFGHGVQEGLIFETQPRVNGQVEGNSIKTISYERIRMAMPEEDTNQFIFESVEYANNGFVEAKYNTTDGFYKIANFSWSNLSYSCDRGDVIGIKAWDSTETTYDVYYLDHNLTGNSALYFTCVSDYKIKHIKYMSGLNGQYSEEPLCCVVKVTAYDANNAIVTLDKSYNQIEALIRAGVSVKISFDWGNSEVKEFNMELCQHEGPKTIRFSRTPIFSTGDNNELTLQQEFIKKDYTGQDDNHFNYIVNSLPSNS